MWKKICYWVVGINYLVGVGSSIYFIGGWINKLAGFDVGEAIVIILQCFFFYCATEVEKFFKQNTIEEYKSKNQIQ